MTEDRFISGTIIDLESTCARFKKAGLIDTDRIQIPNIVSMLKVVTKQVRPTSTIREMDIFQSITLDILRNLPIKVRRCVIFNTDATLNSHDSDWYSSLCRTLIWRSYLCATGQRFASTGHNEDRVAAAVIATVEPYAWRRHVVVDSLETELATKLEQLNRLRKPTDTFILEKFHSLSVEQLLQQY